jgi:hypothetical protein
MILYFIINIVCALFGISLPSSSYIFAEIGDDEKVSSSKEDSIDQDSDSKRESSEGKSSYDGEGESSSHSLPKSTDKDLTSTFRRGTVTPPGSGGPSINDDLNARLARLMLEQTQSFLAQEEQEIKSKGLHTKPESELTLEEADSIKYRESHANQLAETSADLLKLESQSLSKSANPSSSDINPQKRNLESADIDPSNNPDNKKSK